MKAPYLYKGNLYDRLEDLPAVVDLKLLYDRIHKKAWPVEKAVDTPKHEPCYVYKGQKYSRLADLPAKVSVKTLHDRLYILKWPLEKAVETPKRAKYYKYKGQKYLMKQLPGNLPYHILYDRIVGKKWSVEKAVETPYRPYMAKRKSLTDCVHLDDSFDSLHQCCRICGAPRVAAPQSLNVHGRA